MRLIDAEAAKEFLRENLILPDESHEKIAETMIDAIPTAYDIDKVVDELKKSKAIGADCVGEGFECVPLFKAIEIVKHGGASDDVCEWTKIDEEGYKNCKCNYNETMPDFFKYCPYCGKKIKVVE